MEHYRHSHMHVHDMLLQHSEVSTKLIFKVEQRGLTTFHDGRSYGDFWLCLIIILQIKCFAQKIYSQMR
jgi:hypothetical protein